MIKDCSTDGKENHCLNCHELLTGSFCSVCGQKHIEGGLSVAFLVKTLTATITNTDSRVWKTFKALLIEPGVVARNYVNGSRQRYINPIQLFVTFLGVFIGILAIFGWLFPQMETTVTDTKQIATQAKYFSPEFVKAWYQLYIKHRLFIYLAAIPVAAVAVRFVLYRTGQNYVSTLIMLLYAGALYCLYGIFLVLVFALFDLSYLSKTRKMIEAIIGLLVYFQTIKGFYHLSWLKCTLSTVLVFLLLTLSAYFVTFFLSWLIISF